MKDEWAVTTKGNPAQSVVGHALELAGQLLRQGELDRARRVLCDIKADLDRLTKYPPHTLTKEPGDLGVLD